MYIKSIVLDGFKSYGNRVEITGFDPEFNAITGLNGTGKSNILDSICFVLGITNLSNVRAGSLQELIYKHGQAGITKATVSITFDNQNKSQQPIGYESKEITVTRQVVMGGKNKYMINGINVQNKRVSDLFCSVQLNVNNPHFLIMQGRITKVLNMKPPEVLAMVEEAAGTRMYEAKKQAAEKTIERKDAKLRELNEIIQEDIAPKLQKLQDERSQFQEYQKVVRELENLTKLHIAWKYVTAEEKTKEAESKVEEVKNEIASKKDAIKENDQEIKNIEKMVAELNNKLDQESGSVLQQLERQRAAAERGEAGAGAALRGAGDALAAHRRRQQLLRRALDDDRAAGADKRRQLHQVTESSSAALAARAAGEAALAAAERRFLAASSGQGGDAHSLQDQLMAAKQAAMEASTRISASSMEKKHAAQRLQALEQEFRASSEQFQRDQLAITRQQAAVDQIQAELRGLQFDEAQHGRLRDGVRALRAQLRAARLAADKLAPRLHRCSFNYSPPQPGFDPARVHGTVCRLIDVRDPVYCTALETAAGSKLFHVVVDTEVTSKLLLQRGNLQSRTTIIPLNKIAGRVIQPAVLRVAQEVGGGPGSVQLALELVSFPSAVRAAVGWVLGSTLVCRDLQTARRVCFDPRVRCRCVTLDGDLVDPAGTLSGGAPVKGGSVLQQLAELRALETQLQRDQAELDGVQRLADRHHQLQQKYEMLSHELEVVKARLATTTHAQMHAEIESLRQQVADLTEGVERDKLTQKETAAKAKELESKVKDIKGHRERQFQQAELELKAAQRSVEQQAAAWQRAQLALDTLALELAELDNAARAAADQLEETDRATVSLEEALAQAKEEFDRASAEVKELQARIQHQKQEMAARSGEAKRMLAARDGRAKANREADLAVKELEIRAAELQTEVDDWQKKRRAMEAEHAWIAGERAFFGLAGGAYDVREGPLAARRLPALRERRARLARGLNQRAHTLLAKEEDQYQDLLRKKRIVEADRLKLVQVIRELDEKKKQTLARACDQVNRDFGSIFSSLLPGAQARLTPPAGRSVLEGLEVRVGFNDTWKESLGELSGGQRSLVALSLVLAMLLFKPAPLYILDEVDAALDLSHTQNIGLMLREHFRHSQFIIVSLKDGMFNNANVLFRTKFVDGMSTVQRTVNCRR